MEFLFNIIFVKISLCVGACFYDCCGVHPNSMRVANLSPYTIVTERQKLILQFRIQEYTFKQTGKSRFTFIEKASIYSVIMRGSEITQSDMIPGKNVPPP